MVRIPTNRELLRCDLARLIAGDVDLGGTNGSQKWNPRIITMLMVLAARARTVYNGDVIARGGDGVTASVHVATQ